MGYTPNPAALLTWADVGTALLNGVLPQLPLTLLNSVVAVTKVSGTC